MRAAPAPLAPAGAAPLPGPGPRAPGEGGTRAPPSTPPDCLASACRRAHRDASGTGVGAHPGAAPLPVCVSGCVAPCRGAPLCAKGSPLPRALISEEPRRFGVCDCVSMRLLPQPRPISTPPPPLVPGDLAGRRPRPIRCEPRNSQRLRALVCNIDRGNCGRGGLGSKGCSINIDKILFSEAGRCYLVVVGAE